MQNYLGIEFGSTRIKAVLIDEKGAVLCGGNHAWENKLTDGLWSYNLTDAVKGMQSAYAALNEEYTKKYGTKIKKIDGIGLSAMMHGYLAFDEKYKQLVPFRTWRNTNTFAASEELSIRLEFNMPQRWSSVHFYQAVLNKEKHVAKVAHLHTLSSYMHYLLSGKETIGVGDAAGMFPIEGGDYDAARLETYNELLKEHGVHKNLRDLLPPVLSAGQNAGALTEAGAHLLDPSGALQAGAPMCPPEGDAGTGMVATNAVREKTGNVSAGTSAFVMVVLEKALSKAYSEIDIVTTPSGKPVAMVHVNNCTNEINMWADLFGEVAELAGAKIPKGELLTKLFQKSEQSDESCGKFMGYNFLSGEPMVEYPTGAPVVLRAPDSVPTLANFMQMQIYSALAVLNLGMEILAEENVQVQEMYGHGGFFKTERIGQTAMSAALHAPVTVMKNAGEGGAWGIAVLALYAAKYNGKPLEDYLQELFADADKVTLAASDKEQKKFDTFMKRYRRIMLVARLAATQTDQAKNIQ